MRQIAKVLGRTPSTISRELASGSTADDEHRDCVSMANGKAVGGQYMNAMVMLTPKGEFALQVPLKFKKVPLNPDTVTAWEELTSETRADATGAFSAVGQAVAGVVLPGLGGKMASAAIGSTIDSTRPPPRTLRIDLAAGKQSTIELPEKLFKHLAALLKDRQTVPAAPTLLAAHNPT